MLVAQEGPLKGQRWALSHTLMMGRDATCEIVIQDRQVSRFHARLTPTREGVMLEDLGSKNGTYVRGERLSSAAPLLDGDEIRLGRVRMTFNVLAGTASTQTDIKA